MHVCFWGSPQCAACFASGDPRVADSTPPMPCSRLRALANTDHPLSRRAGTIINLGDFDPEKFWGYPPPPADIPPPPVRPPPASSSDNPPPPPVGARNGYHLSFWRFFPFYSNFWPNLRPIHVARPIVVLWRFVTFSQVYAKSTAKQGKKTPKDKWYPLHACTPPPFPQF